MGNDQIRDNFHLTLKVRKPLLSSEKADREANQEWVDAVKRLLTPLDDGSYPWQKYLFGDGTVIEFKSLNDYISSEDGLRTSPDKMLQFMESGFHDDASETAEMLRAALTRKRGRPPTPKQDDGENGNNISNYVKPAKGTSRANTIRQIRQLADSDSHQSAHAAELLEQIHRQEISASKAAILLGLRQKVVNFDLNKLTTEVRSEIDNLKEQEDWTTAEVIEEALRAYFRVINSEEPDDCASPITVEQVTPAPAPKAQRRRAAPLPRHEYIDLSEVDWLPMIKQSRHAPPEYIRQGSLVDQYFPGINAEKLKLLALDAPPNKCVVIFTDDNSKRFTRHPEQSFWQSLT